MYIQVEGDHDVAEEVLNEIYGWDAAVSALNIDGVVQHCTDRVSLFDVSSQLTGVALYRKAWEQFSPYFCQNMRITRRNVTLYCSHDLAVMHCYSKVEDASATPEQNDNQQQNPSNPHNQSMPWCRTTLCLQKQNGIWLVVHQHISMPVNMSNGNAIVIKDVPKLRLVI